MKKSLREFLTDEYAPLLEQFTRVVDALKEARLFHTAHFSADLMKAATRSIDDLAEEACMHWGQLEVRAAMERANIYGVYLYREAGGRSSCEYLREVLDRPTYDLSDYGIGCPLPVEAHISALEPKLTAKDMQLLKRLRFFTVKDVLACSEKEFKNITVFKPAPLKRLKKALEEAGHILK